MPRAPDFPERPASPIRIAISECLLGREVRYDGTDSASAFPHDKLQGVFTYLPICPEVGIGMGVPRDPIRLIGDPARPGVALRHEGGGEGVDHLDWSAELKSYGQHRLEDLVEVAGYVFTQDSPSCGLYQVRVHPESGSAPPSPTGRGIYAQTVTDAMPALPVEEGVRLFDPVLCERFVEQVFRYAHWQRIVALGTHDAHAREFRRLYETSKQAAMPFAP